MAEKKGTEKVAIPKTKFFVSKEMRDEVSSILDTQNLGQHSDKFISSLEKTGEFPDIPLFPDRDYREVLPRLGELEMGVLPFQEGVRSEIERIQPIADTLSSSELRDYLALLEVANVGEGSDEIIQENKQKFFEEVSAALNTVLRPPGEPEKKTGQEIKDVAMKAAERFVVQRKTGEMALDDFISKELGVDLNDVSGALSGVKARLGEFIRSDIIPGAFQGEISKASKLIADVSGQEEEKRRQTQQQELAESQRQKSDVLFQNAIQALAQPVPLFTPQRSQEALAHIQETILGRGETALSSVEAQQAQRGLTGSSIEAFALAEQEGNIVDALANATFQFLSESGEAGQRNKEVLAQSLLSQAQVLLGAGQQTEGLVTGREVSSQELNLNRNRLQAQIQQFNQQLQESQRQFTQNLDFQKQTAAQNLQLLLQQLSQPRRKNIGSALLGGAGAGAGLGFLVGGPLGAAIGAGVGGVGGGLGEAFGG